MSRTYISVGNRELIDVLYRIARNERVAAGRRIESVELIARLKGLRGFQNKRPKPVLVVQPVLPPAPEPKPEPVIDLLGLKGA